MGNVEVQSEEREMNTSRWKVEGGNGGWCVGGGGVWAVWWGGGVTVGVVGVCIGVGVLGRTDSHACRSMQRWTAHWKVYPRGLTPFTSSACERGCSGLGAMHV